MNRKNNRKLYDAFLAAGIVFSVCIIADCLIGWMPSGGEPLMLGFANTRIAEVPMWHYVLALPFGAVLAVIFMVIYTDIREFVGSCYSLKKLKPDRTARVFTISLAQMPLLMILIHSEFCLYMMFLKEAAGAGLSAEVINERFLFPILITLVPPYIWEMIVVILFTYAACRMIVKGIFPVRRSAVLCTPFVTKMIIYQGFHAIYLMPGAGNLRFLDMTTDSISWALFSFMMAHIVKKTGVYKND